jgi:hypothetical protein
VFELTEFLLAPGYVSLAAVQVLCAAESAAILGDRDERWVVSGYPDDLGIDLGCLTPMGFRAWRSFEGLRGTRSRESNAA